MNKEVQVAKKELLVALAWGGGIVLLALAATFARNQGYIDQDTVLRVVIGINGLLCPADRAGRWLVPGTERPRLRRTVGLRPDPAGDHRRIRRRAGGDDRDAGLLLQVAGAGAGGRLDAGVARASRTVHRTVEKPVREVSTLPSAYFAADGGRLILAAHPHTLRSMRTDLRVRHLHRRTRQLLVQSMSPEPTA